MKEALLKERSKLPGRRKNPFLSNIGGGKCQADLEFLREDDVLLVVYKEAK